MVRCLKFPATTVAVFSILSGVAAAQSADKSRIPPVETYRAMLDASKGQGWVQFRNYNGRQLVYFTPLQTLHCRLKAIRYSINSETLEEEFPLVSCNPQQPFSLPPEAGLEEIAISLPLGTAKTVSVQAIWEDGSPSAIAVYEPCKDVGEQTCAWPLD